MEWLARHDAGRGLAPLAAPVLFGIWLLYVWEVAVVGFGVPQILLPAPHQIGHQLASQAALLWVDFRQTFLKAVLSGYAIGCGLGFVVAILADRVPFLRRGLLPIGNLVSALPIIGIAPIMVMWFGFDWPSKAAVVVIMTFFPMLVNTRRRARRLRADGARPDAHLRGGLLADAVQAAAAGRAAVHLQRAEDQLDSCPDRRHRGRVLRHADRRHGIPHLHRGRAHEHRHGLGGNRRGGAGGLGVLWLVALDRARRHVLASVLPADAERSITGKGDVK